MRKLLFLFILVTVTFTNLQAQKSVIHFDNTVIDDVIYDYQNPNSFSCEIPFKNVGDAPLVLNSAIIRSNALKVTYPKTPIQPGNTGVIRLTNNPNGGTSEMVLGNPEKKITIRYNNYEDIIILTVKVKTINTEVENNSKEREPNPAYDIVEEMPKFSDGNGNPYNYIYNAIHIPSGDIENNVGVLVNFVVEKDGSLSNIKGKYISKGKDDKFYNEIIRIIQSMPKWKPGKQGGKPVRVKHFLHIFSDKVKAYKK